MKTVTLTENLIRAMATNGCGFTREQMDILGVGWPPPKGWIKRLIGTAIPEDTYSRLLAMKGKGRKWRAENSFPDSQLTLDEQFDQRITRDL
jgi:hypothetical protein